MLRPILFNTEMVPALAMTGRGTGGLIARATDRKSPGRVEAVQGRRI